MRSLRQDGNFNWNPNIHSVQSSESIITTYAFLFISLTLSFLFSRHFYSSMFLLLFLPDVFVHIWQTSMSLYLRVFDLFTLLWTEFQCLFYLVKYFKQVSQCARGSWQTHGQCFLIVGTQFRSQSDDGSTEVQIYISSLSLFCFIGIPFQMIHFFSVVSKLSLSLSLPQRIFLLYLCVPLLLSSSIKFKFQFPVLSSPLSVDIIHSFQKV